MHSIVYLEDVILLVGTTPDDVDALAMALFSIAAASVALLDCDLVIILAETPDREA